MGTSHENTDYAIPSDWISDIWSDELQIWLDLYATDLPLDLDQTGGFEPSDSASNRPGVCTEAIVDSALNSGNSGCDDSMEATKNSNPQPAHVTSVIRGWVPYRPEVSLPDYSGDGLSISVVSAKQSSRRTGPLDPVKRQKARCVRKIEACWRCKVYRQAVRFTSLFIFRKLRDFTV